MDWIKFATTSRIKTVRAGELDCLQKNKLKQTSREFRFETNLSIVFIQCCQTFFIPDSYILSGTVLLDSRVCQPKFSFHFVHLLWLDHF